MTVMVHREATFVKNNTKLTLPSSLDGAAGDGAAHDGINNLAREGKVGWFAMVGIRSRLGEGTGGVVCEGGAFELG